MEEPRDIKTLLKLLLEYITPDNHINTYDFYDHSGNYSCYRIVGLCISVHSMEYNNVITKKEKDLLHTFILSNRPTKGKFFDPYHKDDPFFWDVGKKPIRIAWVKEKIKRTPYGIVIRIENPLKTVI